MSISTTAYKWFLKSFFVECGRNRCVRIFCWFWVSLVYVRIVSSLIIKLKKFYGFKNLSELIELILFKLKHSQLICHITSLSFVSLKIFSTYVNSNLKYFVKKEKLFKRITNLNRNYDFLIRLATFCCSYSRCRIWESQ